MIPFLKDSSKKSRLFFFFFFFLIFLQIFYFLKFEAVKMFDSKKPVEMFMENIYPYGEQILTHNEDFFKKDEFVNGAENISGKIGLIDHWDSLDEKTKNTIWEYMKGLYILGMACLNKEAELSIILQKTNIKY